MKLYPAMIDLTRKNAIVIGGGEIAARKIKDLIECGATVTIISPKIHEKTQTLIIKHGLEYIKRVYSSGDLKGAFIVVAATNNHEVNNQIAYDAHQLNILINCVDDPDNCSFYVPSYFRKGDLLVAVSTSGASPSMATKIRRSLEESIKPEIEQNLQTIKEIRSILKEDEDFSDLDQSKRGELLKKITADSEQVNTLSDIKDKGDKKAYLFKILDD